MDLRDRQEIELFKLVRAAKDTQFGKSHRFTDLQRYEDFRDEVPLSFYSDITAQIEEIKSGASDVLWPGKVQQFAVSAGTSGTGKHLPLTNQRIKSDRRFMRQITFNYFLQRPNIFRLWGKHISLPGSLEQSASIDIGEISAFTARNIPWWLSHFQLFDTEQLVQWPLSQKIDRVLEKAEEKDIRVISSAPSWVLTLFQRLLNRTGATSVSEVWPNLTLLVCGGVKLANYRSHLQKLIGPQEVDFIETYGASEGYFAFSDNLDRDDLKLIIDNEIFYEFIPNPLPNKDSLAIQETIPLWEVEPDTPYAMIVSTNAGLWRYALNDIVEFTQTEPPRLKVMGRVNEMLDDYGEALYAYEAEQALSESGADLDLDIGCFTIGAQMENEQTVPRHFWFVQTYDPIHRDTLDRLAKHIDTILQEKNRHYAIRRESGSLDMPEVYSISQQQINNWLEQHGKHKAQGKLPAILRDEEDIRFFR
ncbi:MAG: GH3 auxin-responsive promoter family protein [Fodinibius sp.]|nr:GH3 auxin-responsive promoter family protein [Fodinibius sp.]